MPRRAVNSAEKNQMDLAIALSKSLEESNTRQLSELAEELPASAIENDTVPQNIRQMQKDFWARLNPIQPGPTKKCRQRKKVATSVPALLTRSSEQRLQILTEKIALILLAETQRPPEPDVLENLVPKKGVWDISFLTYSAAEYKTMCDNNMDRNFWAGRLLQIPEYEPEDYEPQPVVEAENEGNPPELVARAPEEPIHFEQTAFHIVKVCDDYSELVGSPIMSDIHIHLQDGRIMCGHQLIIYIRAPNIFHDIQAGILHWEHLSFEEAYAFLDFVYCGRFMRIQALRSVYNIYKLSEKYEMREFMQIMEGAFPAAIHKQGPLSLPPNIFLPNGGFNMPPNQSSDDSTVCCMKMPSGNDKYATEPNDFSIRYLYGMKRSLAGEESTNMEPSGKKFHNENDCFEVPENDCLETRQTVAENGATLMCSGTENQHTMGLETYGTDCAQSGEEENAAGMEANQIFNHNNEVKEEEFDGVTTNTGAMSLGGNGIGVTFTEEYILDTVYEGDDVDPLCLDGYKTEGLSDENNDIPTVVKPIYDFRSMSLFGLELMYKKFGLKPNMPMDQGIRLMEHIQSTGTYPGGEIFNYKDDSSEISFTSPPVTPATSDHDTVIISDDDVAEESETKVTKEEMIEFEVLPDMKSAIRTFIRERPEIYKKVLQYEPVGMESFYADFKTHVNVKVKLSKVIDIFDEECITYRMVQGISSRRRGSPKKKQKSPSKKVNLLI